MNSPKIFVLVSAVALFFQGCVSKGVYEKLQADSSLQSAEQSEKIAAQELKIRELEGTIREESTLIDDLTAKLGKVTTNKAQLADSLAETRQALRELTDRKLQMESQLKDFRDLTSGLQSMIDTGSVKIHFVKGRMVVSLGSDVLFTSGSARLSADGRDAVDAVTKQLTHITGKDFQIEGHTDNVPIKTKEFPSNWELASARALTVVNTMIAAGMPAARISAASYAETRPAAANETKEGRDQNRRIDVVVVPDLSKLMDVAALDRQSNPERKITSEKPRAK